MTVDVYCFPDTNTFLHFRDFQDIDWASVLGVRKVTLVITETVISELDQFKNDRQSERRRTRSRLALKQIESFAQATSLASSMKVRKGVNLYLDMSASNVEAFEGLESHIADHIIFIARALSLQGSVSGSLSIIVSDDTGMRIKARSLGLDARSLPDELRLPDEPTVTEQQLKRTKAELQSVLEKVPQLELFFDLQEPASKAVWRSVVKTLTNDQVEAELETRKNKVEAKLMGAAFLKYAPSLETKKKVVAYETKCRQYFAKLNEYLDFWARTVQLNLILHNTGNQPANDVVVDFSALLPARLYDIDHLPERPSEPEQPTSTFEVPALGIPYAISNLNTAKWHLLSEQKAQYRIPKVLHNVPERLEAIYLGVPSNGVEAVRLDFTLHAANIPSPIDGYLSLIVERGE